MGYIFEVFSMKTAIYKIFFIIFLSFISTSNLFADSQKSELDKLFNNLKIKNASSSIEIEQKIWKIWSTHPKDIQLTKMLENGSELVRTNKYLESINLFSKVIDLDPNWAEAWNKRATVFYLIGEFQKSQNDIDEVLKLENRHFGALAGQGLINIKLGNYEKAIKSYRQALEIYPTMQSAPKMIKQIEEIIKEELI